MSYPTYDPDSDARRLRPVVAIFFMLLATIGEFCVYNWALPPTDTPPVPAAQDPARPTVEEMKERIRLGMTTDQVRQAIGDPDRVQDFQGTDYHNAYWYYGERLQLSFSCIDSGGYLDAINTY